MTEEEKKRNYNELLLAQIKYENSNREKNYGKETDDIFSFFFFLEKDYNGELRKMNINDNDQKKIKSNSFLQSNKTNKRINKFSSVDQKGLGSKKSDINYENKLYTNYNYRSDNLYYQSSGYHFKHYGY